MASKPAQEWQASQPALAWDKQVSTNIRQASQHKQDNPSQEWQVSQPIQDGKQASTRMTGTTSKHKQANTTQARQGSQRNLSMTGKEAS
jgi:hypothetical protein